MLYMAMEDFRIDVIVGKGPGATSIPLELAPFTLVGATTRSGMLTGPLRDRFGFTAQMEFYDTPDLTQVVSRAAKIIGVGIDPDAAVEIASRSRGTPRIASILPVAVTPRRPGGTVGVVVRLPPHSPGGSRHH